MSQLLSRTPSRISAAQIPRFTQATQQVRHASLIKRPLRPYTFTQLITLSDGSTYTQRTTSPAPVFKSTKDTRNHVLWQPSLDSLRNVEQDEAGRLKAFREKFGRGWDAEEGGDEGDAASGEAQEDSLMDLISGFQAEGVARAGEGKKGKK